MITNVNKYIYIYTVYTCTDRKMLYNMLRSETKILLLNQNCIFKVKSGIMITLCKPNPGFNLDTVMNTVIHLKSRISSLWDCKIGV